MAVAIAFCSLTLAASCGSSKKMPEIKGKLPVFPVQGKLTAQGKPLAGAFLVFYPIRDLPEGSAKTLPRARTLQDGTFSVSTYGANDGAPAGKYRVTVSWKGFDEGVTSQETRDSMPEKLPANYQNSRRTKLRAEIAEGENSLPDFDLTDVQVASESTQSEG
jgi:hypothetical protein